MLLIVTVFVGAFLSTGDLLPVMCERAGFQQETSLILYEVTHAFFGGSHPYTLIHMFHKWHSLTQFHLLCCISGSKAQPYRADPGLRCLSGQGPGWAHGWGHHRLPEVRTAQRLVGMTLMRLAEIIIYIESSTFNTYKIVIFSFIAGWMDG